LGDDPPGTAEPPQVACLADYCIGRRGHGELVRLDATHSLVEVAASLFNTSRQDHERILLKRP
jgi:hypothetical protein